jgi:hypothetical protein
LFGQLGALVLTALVGAIVHHPAWSFLVLAVATAAAAAALVRVRSALASRS